MLITSRRKWTVLADDSARRAVDLLVSAFGLILLTPVFFLITLAILVDDGPPVFFRQVRVGRAGKLFRIWKFRTMHVNAEVLGPKVTRAGDPRVTRVGRFLRRTKLDELPQLINVLRGEMSLVGPRPEVPEYVVLYDEVARRILDFKPGLTDPATLLLFNEEDVLAQSNRDDFYVSTILPEKLRLQLAYLESRTIFSDIRVILQTIRTLMSGQGSSNISR
ncbi:MAG: glycosyl transferase [Nitrospiraceae bacterium]|nr:MAG: glycosyl transferase [Nitrospiraceae bacterium]